MKSKIEKIIEYLICPKDKSKLTIEDNFVISEKNKNKYQIKDGKIFFVNNFQIGDESNQSKNLLKKYLNNNYYKILKYFGPTYPYNYLNKIKNFLDIEGKIVLNVGSGNQIVHESFINLDFFPHENVDVVADASNLPFKSEIIDCIVSRSFIEHINYPSEFVNEIYRCLKKNAVTIHSIPFMYPYHSSPQDFTRYTHTGIENLFLNFEKLKISNLTGPFTLLVLILVDFFSSIFSFSNSRIKNILNYLFLSLFFWLKYFDIFCVNKKSFYCISPTFICAFKKND